MDTSGDTDVALARALREGREYALEAFVDHFQKRVFQYSFLMCGHREDAEEVAQDTLLAVTENFATLREPEKVRAWVFRIAKNACLMKRRRSLFAPWAEVPWDDTADDLVSTEMPDTRLYEREVQQALAGAIRQLPPNYRAVVLLRDVEELSTEETADILELSEDLVRQRLHRGRVALRKLLASLDSAR